MPTGVGAVCSSSSLVPTVPLPASSAGATLCQQVFSASATSAGVANTSNVPLPMVFAVFSALTRTLCSPQIPVSNFIYSSSLCVLWTQLCYLWSYTFIRYHKTRRNALFFAYFFRGKTPSVAACAAPAPSGREPLAKPETFPPPLKSSPAGGRWRDEGQHPLAPCVLSGAPAPALPKGEPSR